MLETLWNRQLVSKLTHENFKTEVNNIYKSTIDNFYIMFNLLFAESYCSVLVPNPQRDVIMLQIKCTMNQENSIHTLWTFPYVKLEVH